MAGRRRKPKRKVLVRATVNLPGLRAGREAIVDPSTEYVKRVLAAGYLVPVDPTEFDEEGEVEESAVSDDQGESA